MKLAIFTEDLPKMLPTKFGFIWQSGFRGEDLKKSVNQKQEFPFRPDPLTNMAATDDSSF
jgi:hypothetical protein